MEHKWTALGMKRMLAEKGDNIDDTLEEWADALAEKPNTWETLAVLGIVCVAVGLILGWWFFRGAGCPTQPIVPPVAVGQPSPLPAATAPAIVERVVSGEVKVHAEGGQVVCEVHPSHRGR